MLMVPKQSVNYEMNSVMLSKRTHHIYSVNILEL